MEWCWSKKNRLLGSAELLDQKPIERLINGGVDINLANSEGNTALHIVSHGGWRLGSYQAKINTSDCGGKPYPDTSKRLMASLEIDKIKSVNIVRFLIERGGDPNVRNSWGKTPLMNACWAGLSEVVELLVATGADVNSQDRFRHRPLHHAVENGNIKVIDLLLQSGAEIDAKDSFGHTPLMRCVQFCNRYQCAKFLIEHGANIYLTSDDGKRAIDLAKKYHPLKNINLIELLRSSDTKGNEERWETKYCRAKRRNVKIDNDSPHLPVCQESQPVEGACEKYECIYHNVMVIASIVFVNERIMSSSVIKEIKDMAKLIHGAVDYCG